MQMPLPPTAPGQGGAQFTALILPSARRSIREGRPRRSRNGSRDGIAAYADEYWTAGEEPYAGTTEANLEAAERDRQARAQHKRSTAGRNQQLEVITEVRISISRHHDRNARGAVRRRCRAVHCWCRPAPR